MSKSKKSVEPAAEVEVAAAEMRSGDAANETPSSPQADFGVATEAAPFADIYRVSLACPTPLAHPTLDVSAAGHDDAIAKFNAENGIFGSVHPYSVEKLT